MKRTWGVLCGMLLGATIGAQSARPDPGDHRAPEDLTARRLVAEGRRLMQQDDLVASRQAFRELRRVAPDNLQGLLGLGQVHLKLGDVALAARYARKARRVAPSSADAAALEVRALLRARRFERALEVSTAALADLGEDSSELWAAHAASLFRTRKTAEAAQAYRRVLALDPMDAEAHIRLGSGLTEPRPARRSAVLIEGLGALREGDLDRAILRFNTVLAEDSDHAIAHRLLGDALLRRAAERCISATSPEFSRLANAVPVPQITGATVEKFMPAYESLSPPRRRVATRALGLFGSYLPKLTAIGGRHDLLTELERTTDHPARAGLRGKKTFDGRVWDDVRGIGGLRAATGIESLDEAAEFSFDTLMHEVAHQVHLYVFKQSIRLRVRELYRIAQEQDLFLDYYAANNEAEYFAQGVEAFVSLGKRPGRQPTHGHTRFELYRRDRALYDLIEGLVDHDPLASADLRRRILPEAVRVALRCGRAEDAVIAAEMMDPSEERTRLLAHARRAVLFSRSL